MNHDQIRDHDCGAIGKPLPPPRSGPIMLADFHAYLPSHMYLFVPTREMWPASSVDGRLQQLDDGSGRRIRASLWLDRNRAVQQVTWHPNQPQLIEDRLVDGGQWVTHPGARVFNMYRPPAPVNGDPAEARPWIDHVNRVFPHDASHIISWLAHRIQRPGEKVNHALVIGGSPGIGKDTLLEPVIAGVGPWNWSEVNPAQMLGRFNGWTKAVVVRVSEARDLGEFDRFKFYDHSKTYIASPPDVIRVDEKHLREHPVANVMGIVITTNHLADGIYLPADDRRHFVAWSEATREDFPPAYWERIYGWYSSGGIGHVCAYLRNLDISSFDPKAPPPKTAAFWTIVSGNEAPDSGELRDVIEKLGNPNAVTLSMLVESAKRLDLYGLIQDLEDRRSRRAIPHKLERVGYVPVRNPDAPKEGDFRVGGRRQVVYAIRTLSLAQQIDAARALVRSG